MEMEVDSDCSDSDGHGNDNNQEAIAIPISKRNDPTPAEGFRIDNGVTKINFAKSKNVECDNGVS